MSSSKDIELNEEQKSELVQQLVRLIKDQTKKLEEHKSGNNVAIANGNICESAVRNGSTFESNAPLKTCRVPQGWERVHVSDPFMSVIYISPSGEVISNMSMLRNYFLRADTCKCGIECPLNLLKVFNFDALVANSNTNEAPVSGDGRHNTCTCLLSNGNLLRSDNPALMSQVAAVSHPRRTRPRGRPRKADDVMEEIVGSIGETTNHAMPPLMANIDESQDGIVQSNLPQKCKGKRSAQRKRKKNEIHVMPSVVSTVGTTVCSQPPMDQWAQMPQSTTQAACNNQSWAYGTLSTQAGNGALQSHPSRASFDNEAAAIRHLLSLVSSARREESTHRECVKEFDPDPDFLQNLCDCEIQGFAKHVVFSSPSDERNSFTLDPIKPKTKSKRNNDGKPARKTTRFRKSVSSKSSSTSKPNWPSTERNSDFPQFQNTLLPPAAVSSGNSALSSRLPCPSGHADVGDLGFDSLVRGIPWRQESEHSSKEQLLTKEIKSFPTHQYAANG